MNKQKYNLERLPFYSGKVSIKGIENGWLIHYDEQHWNSGLQRDEVLEFEKAFTYDFNDETVETWKELVKFVASKITGRGTWINLYPEEKIKWDKMRIKPKRKNEEKE